MADFIPGLKLGELFFHEAVKPLFPRRRSGTVQHQHQLFERY